MELAHFGVKALYPPTVQPVLDLNIPIHIKNTFEPDAMGTVISNKITNGQTAKGISNINDIALLTLQGIGMVGIPLPKQIKAVIHKEKKAISIVNYDGLKSFLLN